MQKKKKKNLQNKKTNKQKNKQTKKILIMSITIIKSKSINIVITFFYLYYVGFARENLTSIPRGKRFIQRSIGNVQ